MQYKYVNIFVIAVVVFVTEMYTDINYSNDWGKNNFHKI